MRRKAELGRPLRCAKFYCGAQDVSHRAKSR